MSTDGDGMEFQLVATELLISADFRPDPSGQTRDIVARAMQLAADAAADFMVEGASTRLHRKSFTSSVASRIGARIDKK